VARSREKGPRDTASKSEGLSPAAREPTGSGAASESKGFARLAAAAKALI
jgi:hypothetical protein